MKCENCGGRLDGVMTFCWHCGVRQDVDTRQIDCRDLGEDAALPCPSCETPERVVEFASEPAVRIEHCTTWSWTPTTKDDISLWAAVIAAILAVVMGLR